MAIFEISVNGERRFAGEGVKAVTLFSDPVARRQADRVSLHVGVGGQGEREVQYLGSDLHPGDEIVIRLLEDEAPRGDAFESCSFCGEGVYEVASLVAGTRIAICSSCMRSFDGVVTAGAPLPAGASIRQEGDRRCGFCRRGVPEVPALLARNEAAICPECLHACVDMTKG
jgi:hypothetical protein